MTMLPGFMLSLVLTGATSDPGRHQAGAFAELLWLVQRVGMGEVADPANDRVTKGRIASVLSDAKPLRWPSAGQVFDEATFRRLAGEDEVLDQDEIRRELEVSTPESRSTLNSAVREHLEFLSTSFDSIAEGRQELIQELASWIAANHRSGEPLHVVVVCTGNSRRSILGSTLGNASAAYVGLPEVRFHSGGTEPSAMNRRTIATLEAIGIVIRPTGEMGPSGAKGEPNPRQFVAWGEIPDVTDAVEFSKRYDDPVNPQSGFAALMVCSEADAECPNVRGAAERISMPFLDPKSYDDSRFEVAKYAERRDEIGRVLLAALGEARRLIDQSTSTSESTSVR